MTDAAVQVGKPGAGAAVAEIKALADRRFGTKRLVAFGAPGLILAYFVYIFFAFDIPGLYQRAQADNAVALVSDMVSYKTHVTRSNRGEGSYEVAIEGERKGSYTRDRPDDLPDWVTFEDDDARIDLDDGYRVVWDGPTVRMTIPDFGVIEVTPDRRGLEYTLPPPQMVTKVKETRERVDGDLVVTREEVTEMGYPDWISLSNTRVDVRTGNGRLTVTKAKTEVFRYFYGWELFFFTLDSPFYGKGVGELVGLAFSSERVREGQSNIAAMAGDFWDNKMWRHGEVAWAIFETVLMAFLGTFGAAMVALPLAFLAARNFTPLRVVMFGVRRVFDFMRGVDALIWTIILSRAFGPGPMTGAIAILLTDSGTFGKLFSEALENVDNKQIEGVQSTGAKPIQRYRFGVIPQITPVLLSQLLYYLESNTRSATIICAIVGGGIGLLLTQAIITQKDWEEVTYYIVLIVLMVMVMDTISGWLRRKLIRGDAT